MDAIVAAIVQVAARDGFASQWQSLGANAARIHLVLRYRMTPHGLPCNARLPLSPE
jgi:hypothetical protein